MKRLVLAAFVVALAVPAQASAGRFAIGIQKGADERAVAREVQAVTGEPVTKIGPFALSVRAQHAGELLSLNGTSWVERMRATRRLAFTPNDPLISRQWYLGRIHAFDAWAQLPTLANVRVAVLDSGIDSATRTSRARSSTGGASSRARGRPIRTATAPSSRGRSQPRRTTEPALPPSVSRSSS